MICIEAQLTNVVDIAAIISGVLTFLGVIITVISSNSKRDLKMEQSLNMVNTTMSNQLTLFNQTVNSKFTMVDDSIRRLEQKQEKYNHLQERTYELEKNFSVLQMHDKAQDDAISDIKTELHQIPKK